MIVWILDVVGVDDIVSRKLCSYERVELMVCCWRALPCGLISNQSVGAERCCLVRGSCLLSC